MSVLVLVVGALTAVVGLVLIAAGIPVKEFSFGNTLILSGTIAITGGFIVAGLGAVLSQLNRIADMLAARPATRADRAMPPFPGAPSLGAGPGQIPFPPKTKATAPEREIEPPFARMPEPDAAPTSSDADHLPPILRNPEAAEADETPLMPRQMPPAAAPAAPEPPRPASAANNAVTAGRRTPPPVSPPQPNYFDAMWPADSRGSKAPNNDADTMRNEPPIRESMRETVMRESVLREPVAPTRSESARAAAEIRAVPVLKSGVIDGMGYTLYVDGSIEAELPDGTLRFGSIGELREHLEKSP